MQDKFNKAEYDNMYHKENYKQFSAKLKNDEYKEINSLLENYNLQKPLFIKICKHYLERGELKMKKCEEIKSYLERKEIKIDKDEREDFNLGNYPAQSSEDDIELEDGHLYYNINKEETKCYISISRRTSGKDINDEVVDDSYFDGYFDTKVLSQLLELIDK